MSHRYRPLFLIVLWFFAACSAAPEKSEEEILEGPMQREELPDVDAVVVTDVPSSDEFSEVGDTRQIEVSDSMARAIENALRQARDGNFAAASNALSDLANREDGGFLAAYNLGVLQERRGQYEAAARTYFTSLQQNPDFSPALINLTRLYLRQDRPRDAERIAQRFADARPDNFAHRVPLLEIGLYKGQHEDVIRRAKEILRRDERNVDAMVAMADASFALERFELARAILERAVELSPERADIYNKFGSAEFQLGNRAGAIANYSRAVELQPGYPEARLNLGVLYNEGRDFEAAAQQFLAAIRDYPDFKEAFLNLGNSYKNLNRPRDAETAFKRAIEIDERYADAHFNLGILYMDAEVPGKDGVTRFQRAVESLKRYQELKGRLGPDDPSQRYLDQAVASIEVERQRQQMLREQQMQSE